MSGVHSLGTAPNFIELLQKVVWSLLRLGLEGHSGRGRRQLVAAQAQHLAKGRGERCSLLAPVGQRVEGTRGGHCLSLAACLFSIVRYYLWSMKGQDHLESSEFLVLLGFVIKNFLFW